MTAGVLATVLTGTCAALMVTSIFGSFIAGWRRRTCRKLWVATDVAGLLMSATPHLPPIGVGIWSVNLAMDIHRLIRGDDDDDDRPPRRRKRLRLRMPDLSRLVLPGILRPAGGAA